MRPEDIKTAYHASKLLNILKPELQKLEAKADEIERNEDGFLDPYKNFLLRNVRIDIDHTSARIAAEEPKLQRVLSWAEQTPDLIKQIVHLRVIKLKSWAEISEKLFSSSEQNVAYMRLKRYLDSSQD